MAEYFVSSNLIAPAGPPEHGLMGISRNWQKTMIYNVDIAELIALGQIDAAGLAVGDQLVIDVVPAGLQIMSGYGACTAAGDATDYNIRVRFMDADDLTVSAPGNITADPAFDGSVNDILTIAQRPQDQLGNRTGRGNNDLDTVVVPDGEPVALIFDMGGTPAANLTTGRFHLQFGLVE